MGEATVIRATSIECPICGARLDTPSESLRDFWQEMDCDHCAAPIQFKGQSFGSHPNEDYEVHTRFDFVKLFPSLSSAQKKALKLCPNYSFESQTARDIGANGGALASLNDLWRGKRGLMPPIMFTAWDRNDFDGKRLWYLTKLGRDAKALLANPQPPKPSEVRDA